MIAGLSLLAALAIAADVNWPERGAFRTWLLLLILGVGYTVYSEWLNVSVRKSWAYAPAMPLLPGLGTGLAPLLQWVAVPTMVLRLIHRKWPWSRT